MARRPTSPAPIFDAEVGHLGNLGVNAVIMGEREIASACWIMPVCAEIVDPFRPACQRLHESGRPNAGMQPQSRP